MRTIIKEKKSLLDLVGAIKDDSFDKAMNIVLSKRKIIPKNKKINKN